eukprot:m.25896 g.25896  ORF g.25896 m.25896 type:complete len:74 (-) comp8777_c0_seq1:1910-2131(-)
MVSSWALCLCLSVCLATLPQTTGEWYQMFNISRLNHLQMDKAPTLLDVTHLVGVSCSHDDLRKLSFASSLACG